MEIKRWSRGKKKTDALWKRNNSEEESWIETEIKQQNFI
jgi:hypothetical protein